MNRNPNRKLPLGMPEGSVRAVLTLIVVGFGILGMLTLGYFSMVHKVNVPDWLIAFLAGNVSTVLIYYFSNRAKAHAEKPEKDEHLPEAVNIRRNSDD